MSRLCWVSWAFLIKKLASRFESDHLDPVRRAEWLEKEWPSIVNKARTQGALLLFGDEASFAQWGSLSYTWAVKGQQPVVATTGIRRGYKVFGLLDYFTGQLFYRGHTDKFKARDLLRLSGRGLRTDQA